MASFQTTSEVDAWARQHGGLEAVSEALAKGEFGPDPQSIRTAIRFVEREELKIAERERRRDRRARSLDTAELLAMQAQRYARQAYISRWIAIAAASIAVTAVVVVLLR